MANTYSKDSTVRISTAFTIGGTASDPSIIKCYYKDPNGVTTTLTYGTDGALVKDSTGNYHVDISTTTAGSWFYRFEGSGTLVAANEAEFYIKASNIL